MERGEKGRLPIFKERFRELRGDMTQDAFAEQAGITRPTVGLYENGSRLPDAFVLEKVARRCNASVDWLLGRSEVRNPDMSLQGITAKTGLTEEAIGALEAIRMIQHPVLFPDSRRPGIPLRSTILSDLIAGYADGIVLAIESAFQRRQADAQRSATSTFADDEDVRECEGCLNKLGYTVLTHDAAERFAIQSACDYLEIAIDAILERYNPRPDRRESAIEAFLNQVFEGTDDRDAAIAAYMAKYCPSTDEGEE